MTAGASDRLRVYLDGSWYDLTDLKHPGGDEVLRLARGHDASMLFEEAGHKASTRKRMEKYRVKDKDLPPPTDVPFTEVTRNESVLKWECPLIKNWFVDPRDFHLSGFLFEMFMVTALKLVAFYMDASHLVCAVLFLLGQLWTPRVISFGHMSTHRNMFKHWAQAFLCRDVGNIIYGMPLGVYRLHHVVMHHTDNNAEGRDLSSTMAYRRDSPLHFLHYWGRFVGFVYIELPLYAIRKGWYRDASKAFFGHLSQFVMAYVAYGYRPTAALWFFGLQYLVMMTILMCGNWAEHIFIDPRRPFDSEGHTYIALDTPANGFTLNEGFHLLHHLHPKLHYANYPQTMALYAANIKGTLEFRGLDFFEIALFCFTGQYEKLAKHSNLDAKELQRRAVTQFDQFGKVIKAA